MKTPPESEHPTKDLPKHISAFAVGKSTDGDSFPDGGDHGTNMTDKVDFRCKDYEEGQAVWISHPETAIDDLIDPDQVIHTGNLPIVFTYPFRAPIRMVIGRSGGVTTKKEFVEEICSQYESLYEQEEDYWEKINAGETEDDEGEPLGDESPYGIWGHGIGDLTLVDARFENGYWHLDIDS